MAAITTAAIGVASAGYQVYKGAKDQKAAKDGLADLEVPELNNAFEDIAINTEESDIFKEEGQRRDASLIDLLKSGGTRSVMGGVPKLAASGTLRDKDNRAYLGEKINRREYSVAQDNTRIRGVKEQRFQGEVQGFGQQMMVGNQNMWSGIRGVGSSLSYLGRNLDDSTTGMSEDELAVLNA